MKHKKIISENCNNCIYSIKKIDINIYKYVSFDINEKINDIAWEYVLEKTNEILKEIINEE